MELQIEHLSKKFKDMTAVPRLEDLYLWLFPQDARERS